MLIVKKRIISAFLAAIMLLGMLPAAALAAAGADGAVIGVSGDLPAGWPEAPELPDGPPELEDGQMVGEIHGWPVQKLSAQSLKLLQSQSQNAAAEPDEALRISEGDLIKGCFLYVNGTPYNGGDLVVTEGDNFSYMHFWEPKVPLTGGNWFEYELFQVPGLNLKNEINSTLVINGIKVGDYRLTYNRTTGKMIYRVIFNRYIQLFEGVMALLQGSGKFSSANTTGDIVNGKDSGKLTIEPRPAPPEIPAGPGGGTGWSPSKAPTFNNAVHAFGKGVKWSSKNAPSAHPQIEWRVVFLEQLQKAQRAFLEKGNAALEPSSSYLIIEETLDANQQFYYPINEAGNGKKYDNGAPFFWSFR